MSVLFIAWQDPHSHHWVPVGKLTHERDSFRFTYTRGAKKMTPAFQPFGRMTDLKKSYRADNLFPCLLTAFSLNHVLNINHTYSGLDCKTGM